MRSVSRDEALKMKLSPMTGSPCSFTINRSDWSRMGHALEPRLDSQVVVISSRMFRETTEPFDRGHPRARLEHSSPVWCAPCLYRKNSF